MSLPAARSSMLSPATIFGLGRSPVNLQSCSRPMVREFVSSLCVLTTFLVAFGGLASTTLRAQSSAPRRDFAEFSRQYCIDCHSGADAEAQLDLPTMNAASLAEHYQNWRRVAQVLSDRTMPPAEMDQPPNEELLSARDSIDTALQAAVQQAATSPGPNVIRRLTNAEYGYCIEDLSGLRLDFSKVLVSDAVGGSGFTNAASGQFMQDATLERYLEAAKRIADHLMIGSGPLYFFEDPGQTGLELSAIRRIQSIYQRYGFRAAAGEGAEPFGLERFPKAFAVAWKFQYREQLGIGSKSLSQISRESGIQPKFATHIWDVLNRDQPQFPLDRIITAWRQLPSPEQMGEDWVELLPGHAEDLFDQIQQWQQRLASSASDEEEAALLGGAAILVPSEVDFVARAIRRRVKPQDTFTPDINNESLYAKDGRVRLRIEVESASSDSQSKPTVIFSKAGFDFRSADEVEKPPVPLLSVLSPAAEDALGFGDNPGGIAIPASGFSLAVGQSKVIEVELPDGCRVGELSVTARLDPTLSADSVVRCTISDVTNEGSQYSSRRGRQYSTLLRNPNSESTDRWQQGLTDFARALPQISHREPAPSDRDPIPAPYNNTYNLPERNYFHTAVKYYRDDQFLCDHIISETVAEELDQAWTDLLTSFDYHDVNLRFAAEKFGLEIGEKGIAEISDEWISQQGEEVRSIIAFYKSSFDGMQADLKAAQARHLEDLCGLASRAWRRPLTTTENQSLIDFYHSRRELDGQNHAQALRATLARILVSPKFIYRLEPEPQRATTLAPTTLASRLSFALWSSIPDEQLVDAAVSGRLNDDAELQRQVRRMLKSPKARRMATEFFGQWLGYYQFDQFRGVDVRRFPEFDEKLQDALYDEAISFFEYVIRQDRPYSEIIHADYSLLNAAVAHHYGIQFTESNSQDAASLPTSASGGEDMLPRTTTRVDSTLEAKNRKTAVANYHRGGLLGLGAILTSTSAPLRTSPVKRGDWVLRRLLGTPVPPPPADAGSIPAEEVLSDGLTVRERLEAHRTSAECMNCHVRIDPLGFALENFDSLGRWRDQYLDMQPIDASGETAEGTQIDGIQGLKNFLKSKDHFIRRTLAAKLVAYFLGRPETVYDTALIDRISANLNDDARFSRAIITLVSSPQFQQLRLDKRVAQVPKASVDASLQ